VSNHQDIVALLEEKEQTIAGQQQQLEQLQSTIADQEKHIRILLEELRLGRHRLFGKSSERWDKNQSWLFKVPPRESEAPEPNPALAQADKMQSIGHGRERFPEHLEREVIELSVKEEERCCPDCGGKLQEFGEEITERGHFIPSRILVRRYVRKKYACAQGHTLKCAPLPAGVIEKSKYEPSVYAHVAVAKYADHIPLHRLSAMFKRYGMKLSKSTLWQMVERVSALAAKPIVEQMHKELLEQSHLQADETPITWVREKERGSQTAYLYSYRWGEKIVFDFALSRSRHGPLDFLGDWKGTLLTDGYAGYDEVSVRNRLVRAGCWAHARRKFDEAWKGGDRKALVALRPIQRLFRIESALKKRQAQKKLSGENLLALSQHVRQKRSQRVLEKIQEAARHLRAQSLFLPKSSLGKAIRYLENQWQALTCFLNDPRLPIHNNQTENALRHVALGRKNWLFVNSARGGEVCATLYSLISTCKALSINPESYLEDILQRVWTTPASQIHRLTPWAWAKEKAQQNIPTQD